MPLKVRSNFALGVGPYFGLKDANFESFCVGDEAFFTATRLVWQRHHSQSLDISLPEADSYFVMIYLSDAQHCDVLVGGRLAPLRHYEAGSICVVDLANGAAIRLHSDLDALALCIPNAFFTGNDLFDELAFGLPLRCVRGHSDPLVSHVAAALLPMLDNNAPIPKSVLQPIAIAIGAHLLQRYGEGFVAGHRAGVASETSDACTDRENAASADAEPQALSHGAAGHASETVNLLMPPDWHQDRQMAFAKQCIRDAEADIATVARLCGFSDIELFEEIFRSHTGMSPDRWRQTNLN
ncbi:AraC-like DNA-binding protein [Rhizobium aquaticum]|uniref:AraC-like DNA-binding protein n=1 Tax=Rhizobium aquaticum TaxID=1549636 RepID=A0ABV2IY25_9HYPH